MNRKVFLVAGALLLGLSSLCVSATVTTFFSSGSSCASPITSAIYTPGSPGPSVTVSLCVSTTAESVCGATIQLQSASAAEDARFKVISRTLGSSMTDPNNPSISFPTSITNPKQIVDLGATVTSGTPPAAGATQLLATFALQPQSTATNNSYVVSLSSLSSVAIENSNCFGSPVDVPIAASLTLRQNSVNASIDFNNDGKPDILFRNTANGSTFVWYMNGPSFSSDQLIGGIASPWNVVGTGDFNGDGKPDLIVRNLSNGATFVWYMNGGAFVSDAYLFTVDPTWQIVGVGDFNADGKPDVLFRNSSNGNTFVWYMNNTAFVSDAFIGSIAPPWAIVGVADFNGDGKPDLLIRNGTTGTAFVWYMNGAAFVSDAQIFSVDPSWKVASVADFNADGKPDIVFRSTSSGTAFVWYMNNTAFISDAFMFTIDPSWGIVP